MAPFLDSNLKDAFKGAFVFFGTSDKKDAFQKELMKHVLGTDGENTTIQNFRESSESGDVQFEEKRACFVSKLRSSGKKFFAAVSADPW